MAFLYLPSSSVVADPPVIWNIPNVCKGYLLIISTKQLVSAAIRFYLSRNHFSVRCCCKSMHCQFLNLKYRKCLQYVMLKLTALVFSVAGYQMATSDFVGLFNRNKLPQTYVLNVNY